MKSKMAATAGLNLTLDPIGKALIIFVVSEKKAFEHFPIGSNAILCPAVADILDFRSALKSRNLVKDILMIIPFVCKLFTFQASSPKPLGQLEPNLAGMFLGWSSTKLLFFV
jgi:hypothetical protein